MNIRHQLPNKKIVEGGEKPETPAVGDTHDWKGHGVLVVQNVEQLQSGDVLVTWKQPANLG